MTQQETAKELYDWLMRERNRTVPSAYFALLRTLIGKTAMMPHFESSGPPYAVGNNLALTVKLDRETDDFGHLIGYSVNVDGSNYDCVGVERFAHLAPWPAGELVALLVRPR